MVTKDRKPTEDSRFSKVKVALDLALYLAANTSGRTIDDIQQEYELSRRTAERMRDLVEEAFGELERLPDYESNGPKVRYRLPLPKGFSFITMPTAEELAELSNLAEAMRARDPARADLLDSLRRKIGAALLPKEALRLDPDIEAHLSTEVWAHVPGPAQLCRPEVLKTLRHALLAERAVEVRYRKIGEEEPHLYRLVPFGLILGTRHYIVSGFLDRPKPHLLRLDRIDHAIELDEPGRRPEGFDLRAYADRSFGFFQEEPERIELLFAPAAAAEARNTAFHPTQEMRELEDGRLQVTLEAGGLMELAHFLAPWRDHVEAVRPERLRSLLSQTERAT
ncbi:helix-turn-helix transcriptional regulator [Xanthobacter variabilis]|uniref:helix-turn-helix transcriptional regulator n=1 Tax=Xanthobacter variabilis TaxID=3119932 RepID=UPI00372AE01B